MRCCKCGHIHHELPDIIVPYKRNSSGIIENIIRGEHPADYPCEESTAARLRAWFLLLLNYFKNVIEALKQIYKQDKDLLEELSLLTPLDTKSLETGWLRRLVRITVNSGRWRQTRSA